MCGLPMVQGCLNSQSFYLVMYRNGLRETRPFEGVDPHRVGDLVWLASHFDSQIGKFIRLVGQSLEFVRVVEE